jgi:hypothetical protein
VAPDDPADLPDGARRLLLGPVDSFEKLEVVLALREVKGSSMTPVALATRAGVLLDRLEPAMAELAAAGVVERRAAGTWRLAASADAGALDELAAVWTTKRPAVLKALTGRAVGRIRASAARTFAEAFRLRGRKDDGEKDG